MEDPKKAGKLRERAARDSERLKKNFQKLQRKADEMIVKEEEEIEKNIKRMQIEGNPLYQNIVTLFKNSATKLNINKHTQM